LFSFSQFGTLHRSGVRLVRVQVSLKGKEKKGVKKEKGVEKEKVSVNGIDIFLLEAQDAAWLASYEWNIRARFITS
jgi:hypothetical protein